MRIYEPWIEIEINTPMRSKETIKLYTLKRNLILYELNKDGSKKKLAALFNRDNKLLGYPVEKYKDLKQRLEGN